jgi:hypothetical protein
MQPIAGVLPSVCRVYADGPCRPDVTYARCMPSGRKPTASEVLDVMDGLQADETQRYKLSSANEILRMCADEGLMPADSLDWLAEALQELYLEDLIAFGGVGGGLVEPVVWDGSWVLRIANWRVTAAGRRDAALYRTQTRPTMADGLLAARPAPLSAAADSHDLFISHASEDKPSVVRPLAAALQARGWKVWLDELELTIGDSLSGRIDAALVETHFGVVVLSPAFFAKPWPKRELAGLAAREVAAGSKMILPVWHEVDRDYILQHSPVLADRLGALTSHGIEHVADQISRALTKAAARPPSTGETEPVVQALPGVEESEPPILGVPRTPDETRELLAVRPAAWEHLLFAGTLSQRLKALEMKWHDHELEMPRGQRRQLDSEDLSSLIGWVAAQTSSLMRVFDPAVQEKAFGSPGEPGDPVRIEHLAGRIVSTHEVLMDWAAELRNCTVPDLFDEVVAILPHMVDAPIAEIREFVEDVVDEISHIPQLLAEKGDEPIRIKLKLTLTVNDEVSERLHDAFARAQARIANDYD